MKKSIKRTIACELAAIMAFMNFAVLNANAAGDVASAVSGTWD